MKKVKSIYYLVEEGHYGLKMILEFEDTEYLYFDSCKFLFKKNEKSNLITSKWTKLEYPELEKDDVYIKEIKEDEAIAYFIIPILKLTSTPTKLQYHFKSIMTFFY